MSQDPRSADEIVESRREVLRGMSDRIEDATLHGLAGDLAEGTAAAQEALQRALDYVAQHRTATHDDTAVKRALSLADGALGAEGREVTDPTARLLARLVAEGRMTGDEAMPFMTAMIDADLTDRSRPPREASARHLKD